MRQSLAVLGLLVLLMATLAAPVSAQTPTEDESDPLPGQAPPTDAFLAAAAVPPAPVAPLVVDTGRIRLSVDAVGTLAASGTVEIDKPFAGTVRRAFLTAASTGFTGYEPVDGDISVAGVPVDFDESRTMINGIRSVNVWAEITDIVKPILDAAPSGRSTLTVSEGTRSALIEGAIVAVIFDDPLATIDRSVILAYGAQQVTGDLIRLVRLPDEPLENVQASLGVGISYGFQPSNQDSQINVNGVRLSTSAGGQDDGLAANGALITVGGVGDSIANPTDPFARGSQSTCPGCDDELYDLTSFVTEQGVSELSLTTVNPSADDNFMFAALDVRGATATWTSSADPCNGLDLIECYAPEVRFHPDERYFPWDPDQFIFGSELVFAQTGACFNDTELTKDFTSADIANENYFGAIVSLRPGFFSLCGADEDRLYGLKEFTRPFDGDSASVNSARPAGLDLKNGFFIKFTDGDERIQGYTPLADNRVVAPMFAQILPDERGGGEDVISYLMFYGYDPKADASLGFDLNDLVSIGDGVIAHQGDWERVDVVLGPDDIPTEVRYFAHGCEGPTFDQTHIVSWGNLQDGLDGVGLVDGTHPIVYSAQGSHASYPTEHEAGPQVCPEASGGALKGTTDNARYVPGASAVWQPWAGPVSSLVDPRSRCWHGFGGAWGSTGGALQTAISQVASSVFDAVKDATGPAGPYHNQGNGSAAPVPADCTNGAILVSFTPEVGLDWFDGGTVTLNQAVPGRRYSVLVASVEEIVAEGVAGADGVVVLDYTIPAGTSPGVHRLVVRDGSTGQQLGAKTIAVTVPDECLAGDGSNSDLDGDLLLDDCDPDPYDGPLADPDGDGVINQDDNCDLVVNPDQATNFARSSGQLCDPKEGFNELSVVANPCLGLTPTIVGTEGDDVLTGTNGDDVIVGFGGDDIIDGLGGDDMICVTSGINVIRGGQGADRIYGGVDADQIFGEQGRDLLVGGAGSDMIDGGNGIDLILAGAGDDTVGAATDDDRGDDWIDGGTGNDTLAGGRGDDVISGGPGADEIDGGTGSDQCRLAAMIQACEL